MCTDTEACGYHVHFVGYDGIDYCNPFSDLELAKSEAVSYSEHGCHCIIIVDDNGNEYPF
jgi:hypothetical protein